MLIPGRWPHIVVSNLPLYGNVVSLETFVRILISSLPQGNLGIRYPGLQELVKEILRLMVAQRSGVPYCKEALSLTPADMVTVK